MWDEDEAYEAGWRDGMTQAATDSPDSPMRTDASLDPVAVAVTEHTFTVTYTVNDDGIWLQCTCGWDANLGYDPPVSALTDAVEHHRTAFPRPPRAQA